MTDPMGDSPVIERVKPGGMTAAKRRASTAKAKATVAAKKQAAAAQQGARATAAPTRQSPRPAPPRAEAARDLARETTRRGAAVAIGRDGKALTRRRTTVGDQFEVPANEIPVGWDYQWNPVTVLNKGINEIIQGDLQMHNNGFTPVPSERHAGRWTPVGFEGQIVINGLRLEERPSTLGVEARDEDKARAKAQVRDRTDALRLTQKSLPGSDVASQRNQAGGMKMSIDPALDIPRPAVQVDEEF